MFPHDETFQPPGFYPRKRKQLKQFRKFFVDMKKQRNMLSPFIYEEVIVIRRIPVLLLKLIPELKTNYPLPPPPEPQLPPEYPPPGSIDPKSFKKSPDGVGSGIQPRSSSENEDKKDESKDRDEANDEDENNVNNVDDNSKDDSKNVREEQPESDDKDIDYQKDEPREKKY